MRLVRLEILFFLSCYGFFLQFFSLIVSCERVDEWIERSVHYLIELMNGETDAMIGDAVFFEVIGADFF